MKIDVAILKFLWGNFDSYNFLRFHSLIEVTREVTKVKEGWWEGKAKGLCKSCGVG